MLLLAACCCCLLLAAAAAKPGRSTLDLDTKKGYKTKTGSTSSVTLTLTLTLPSKRPTSNSADFLDDDENVSTIYSGGVAQRSETKQSLWALFTQGFPPSANPGLFLWAKTPHYILWLRHPEKKVHKALQI